jgi:hypothetical protein
VRRPALRLVVALLLVVFVAASSVLFVWPASDQPQHVDAILSLNGSDETAREAESVALAEKGYAHVLLLSQGGYAENTPCPNVPRVVVVCFVPNPARTVGEVEFAARYLRRHGLHSLMVVPGRTQATRARLLVRRCFSGRLVVVGGAAQWLHTPVEVLYGWGATAKALFAGGGC